MTYTILRTNTTSEHNPQNILVLFLTQVKTYLNYQTKYLFIYSMPVFLIMQC